jgi:hypothetical protein
LPRREPANRRSKAPACVKIAIMVSVMASAHSFTAMIGEKE